MNSIKTFAIAAILLTISASLAAQEENYSELKEKIYIHTNHVFFKPGEQLFFKLYVVNGQTQLPSDLSQVVYTDIITPSGSVLTTITSQLKDGYAEGSHRFYESEKGGIYKIRAYTRLMRNEKEATWATKEITVQKIIAPRVLMKLEFRKKAYGAGEEAVADFSMRSLDDMPVRDHPLTYKVSLAGRELRTDNTGTDSTGKAVIKFRLPGELNTRDGLLNVVVNYDSYVESIARSIPIVLNKIDLQLLPEGGSLLENMPGKVAFKAVNEFGKPADVSGYIKNSAGDTVTSFESYHHGMGCFTITPGDNESYTAVITSPAGINDCYPLPKATPKGVAMLFRQDSLVRIKLSSLQQQTVLLKVYSHDKAVYEQQLHLQTGEQWINVNPVQFPMGIARFTVTDMMSRTLAERLVFLHRTKTLQVSISTNKKVYMPRETVKLSVKTTDETGAPLPANLSLSVVDDKLWTLADDKQDNISSWLLMSSELKGKIEEPAFYFNKEEPKADTALDLVMLTNGYRYFEYIDSVAIDGKLRYKQELSGMLTGVVRNKHGKPVKAKVYLLGSPGYMGEGSGIAAWQTDEDGMFFFTGLKPGFFYQLMARSDAKREQVSIKLLKQGTNVDPFQTKDSLAGNDKMDPKVIAPGQELAKRPAVREDSISSGSSKLEDVVVVGYGMTKLKSITGSVTSVNMGELLYSDLNTALQGRLPGIAITRNANPSEYPTISLRGSRSFSYGNAPLIIVNGMPVEKLDMTINPAEIANITVMKDAGATALYGSQAANGVIIITTLDQRNNYGHVRLKLEFPHYASLPVPRSEVSLSYNVRFYAPRYSSVNTSFRDDFRETIYWNPVVQTDKKGEASLSFCNSDATTTFRIIAEGIGYNGKPGQQQQTYSARPALSVDAKIPPYLTVGDTALIPVNLKNNTDTASKIVVSAIMPRGMHLLYRPDTLLLKPDSSMQVLVPATAARSLDDNMMFEVCTGQISETISLPVTVGEKGFPVNLSLSGNEAAERNFIVGPIVKHSLKASFQSFTGMEEQLLHDMRSMLREPYGCFEQVSSTTYPNILILKYLREAKKTNRAVERIALSYIHEGYRKLVGYETSEYGFEWFGRTPAQEVLTAYGLMEFTDMKPFADVNEKMLERTKQFLLNRRDCTGGFMIKGERYREKDKPDTLANSYIVYAFTEAGMGKEVIPEYEASVKAAFATKDPYQLALMAIAAANMQKNTDYDSLMQLLNTTTVKARESIVHSYGASLQVEAMALHALALSKHPHPNKPMMARLLSNIHSERSYYGYGSTQATVLALKAMMAFRLLKDSSDNKTQITARLNDTLINGTTRLDSLIKTGENHLSVSYSGNLQVNPYNFEVSYYTNTPPASDSCAVELSAALAGNKVRVGETIRLNITVENLRDKEQPMTIAKLGIPAGLSLQPWQLKQLTEQNKVAYYEIFDNYLVFYWRDLAAKEIKKMGLDLKADIPGSYKGRANNSYLYYTPEYKHWQEGLEVKVLP
ncbi:TonB-dependent receptor plug domain-containing protein [Filimonas effusa]|uniref:Alpha-2-macroglobulin domain-containing protein n=1 Tax=Filimonas effusa TaxID=2508721 RepID=A0A4Q1D9I6_9BACT|nr:TonB-dependent receptor plug domain-containing protein [Filimonas effusa]RXK86042.1 hypothetical protein ESB13_04325 [Filimonas effusa]